MSDDLLLQDSIIRLYEAEADLRTLPQVVFDGVTRLTAAEVVGYTEQHDATHAFRALLSVEDDPATRALLMQAYARHMHSHPFWLRSAGFFGERALRTSDFFSETEYAALPIAQEALLPAGVRHSMAIVIPRNGYVLTVTAIRVVGRPAFSDAERDRLQIYRAHLSRCYRQAQERTLARLTPAERLRHAFPSLTPRQLDVAAGIADGRSNEEIAAMLGLSIETVRAHAKQVYEKIGANGRHLATVIAHTAAPFTRWPPLWTLDIDTWAG